MNENNFWDLKDEMVTKDLAIDILLKQLQEYKDKIENVRKYTTSNSLRVYGKEEISNDYKRGYADCCIELLQILYEKEKIK